MPFFLSRGPLENTFKAWGEKKGVARIAGRLSVFFGVQVSGKRSFLSEKVSRVFFRVSAWGISRGAKVLNVVSSDLPVLSRRLSWFPSLRAVQSSDKQSNIHKKRLAFKASLLFFNKGKHPICTRRFNPCQNPNL